MLKDSHKTDNTILTPETNYNESNDKQINKQSLEASLSDVLTDAKFPDPLTVVTGKLDEDKVSLIAKAGIEHVINFQTLDELDFDEQTAVETNGMAYTHLPINGVDALKQLNILEFDKILRMHHGKKTLMHCGSGNRVGACVALRAGWLRSRKMDTAIERGFKHGLNELEEEVRMRLLVPR